MKKKPIKKIIKKVKKTKKMVNKIALAVEVKAPKVIKSKIQDVKYWATREHDDPVRDWGTDAPNWLSEYWGSQSHPHRTLILDAIAEIGEVESILEVGCNVGANLNKIHDNFPEMKLYGMDVNSDAIKFASGLIGGTFAVASASKIPLEKKSVDIVMTDATLIYSKPSEIKIQIKEMVRVAKKAIILVEWFNESELGIVKDFHYARNYKKLLKGSGFELVKEHKITETEWQTKSWFTQGYLFIFQAV